MNTMLSDEANFDVATFPTRPVVACFSAERKLPRAPWATIVLLTRIVKDATGDLRVDQSVGAFEQNKR